MSLSRYYRPIILPSMPVMIELPIPPTLSTLLVKLFAWLNLSHLLKATVFVIVRMRAITATSYQQLNMSSVSTLRRTNKYQPSRLNKPDSQNSKDDPDDGLNIQREPEEAFVCCVYPVFLR